MQNVSPVSVAEASPYFLVMHERQHDQYDSLTIHRKSLFR